MRPALRPISARRKETRGLMAFLCVDPRYPKAEPFIDHFVRHHGCLGFGEHVNGLAFDDPRNVALYARCNEHGLPLVFEINRAGLWYDEVGLPGLERCLQTFPDVEWCGHGPGFWAAISGDDDGRPGYPEGPVAPGGALDRLLERYENLYLDLSARSGYNALTRDPEFTKGFVARHWRRMLFGTDIVHPGDALPIVGWLRDLAATEEVRQAIAEGNARRVLGLAASPAGHNAGQATDAP